MNNKMCQRCGKEIDLDLESMFHFSMKSDRFDVQETIECIICRWCMYKIKDIVRPSRPIWVEDEGDKAKMYFISWYDSVRAREDRATGTHHVPVWCKTLKEDK